MSKYNHHEAHRDANHTEIVNALQGIGCVVQDLSGVGGGCPDIMWSLSGNMGLMEIKSDKGKLRDDQVGWHERWKGRVAVVRSPDAAIAEILSAQQARNR